MNLNQLKNVRANLPESYRIRALNDESVIESSGLKSAGGAISVPVSTRDLDKQVGKEISSSDTLFDEKERFSRIESRIALSTFAFIVFVLGFAWVSWENDYAIVGDADVAYNYGLTGGIMMLIILIYAVRKRIKFMRKIGDIKYWYYFHFILGVVGPILIILHTSFQIRSVNGGVAFFAMLSVVFSGFIGRYIYTRASYGLRTLEKELQKVHSHLDQGVLSCKLSVVKPIEEQIKAFTNAAFATPKNLIPTLVRIVSLKHKARVFYFAASRDVSNLMKELAAREGWSRSMVSQRIELEKRNLREHLATIAGIATSRAFEKLAARWRLLHVPVLYLLALSALAHVVAVHMY